MAASLSSLDFSAADLQWKNATLLARGTHAEVRKVFIANKDLACAAKNIRLPLQLGESKPEIQKKLEATLASEKSLCMLKHDNIVKFYDMKIESRDSSVIVFMELVEGPTLENFINKKPLEPKVIAHLGSQICNALSYLHNLTPRAVLHRDINCRTIMVSSEQTIKLIDFGLAIHLVESASEHVSVNPRGDPCFMAPELFLSEDTEHTPYSWASDVWAFGCVVYQMASGRKPHDDCKNMLAIVRRVQRQGAPKLPDQGCPEMLQDFYDCCTKKRKNDRWPAAKLLGHPFLSPRGSGFVALWCIANQLKL